MQLYSELGRLRHTVLRRPLQRGAPLRIIVVSQRNFIYATRSWMYGKHSDTFSRVKTGYDALAAGHDDAEAYVGLWLSGIPLMLFYMKKSYYGGAT